MGQDASKPVEEGATEVYEKLFAAAKAKCAESDAKMWILIADGTGTTLAEDPVEGSSGTLRMTAAKKVNAVVADMELTTGGVFAPFTVGMALCGVRKTLPLKGATKVKFGDSSFVFCCSGWGGPEDDEVVMLAALEAAGFKAGEDGVFVK